MNIQLTVVTDLPYTLCLLMSGVWVTKSSSVSSSVLDAHVVIIVIILL